MSFNLYCNCKSWHVPYHVHTRIFISPVKIGILMASPDILGTQFARWSQSLMNTLVNLHGMKYVPDLFSSGIRDAMLTY